jgi:hypothetical protein
MLTPLQKIHFLEEAASYVEKGWCQHSLAEYDNGAAAEPDSADVDKVCAAGGILRAMYRENFRNYHEDIRPLLHDVLKHLKCTGMLLGDWNDGVCQSQEQAAAALRGTARMIARAHKIKYPLKEPACQPQN